MKRYLLCFLLIIAALNLFAQDKPLLAVTAITANGVAEADAAACRSIVETALFKTDLFTVLSYNDMKEILEAQAFSLSGCTDDSCAIEVGKLLAAENIVLGELSAIGSTYNLAIRLIDVGSSQTLGAEVVTFGSLDEMQEQVFPASFKLAGLDYNPDTGVSFEVAGEIYVTAPDDLELEVFLDGESVGLTPLLLENVPFGSHIIEVKSEDSVFTKDVTILSKDIVEIEADIALLTGNVILTILPKEAEGYEITIGGVPVKNGLNKNVPAGLQNLLAEGAGWFYLDEIDIETGTTLRVTIELGAGGYLQILGAEGADGQAENADGDIIPLEVNASNTLSPGTYIVTLTHADYEDTNISLEIIRDEIVKIEQELEYTEDYFRRERIEELERKLVDVQDKTKFWKGFTWTTGILTMLSGSLAGTGEAFISSSAASLEELAPQYDAASDPAAVLSLGTQITDAEDSIRLWRDIRDVSVYTAASAAVVTGISLINATRESRYQDEISRLKEAMDEK